VTLQDVFVATPPNEDGGAGAGRLLTPLRCTGLKPHFLEKLAANGVVMSPDFFNQERDLRPAFAGGGYA